MDAKVVIIIVIGVLIVFWAILKRAGEVDKPGGGWSERGWDELVRERLVWKEECRREDEKRKNRRKRSNDMMRKANESKVVYEKATPPNPEEVSFFAWGHCPCCMGRRTAVKYASWKELDWTGDVSPGTKPRLLRHHRKYFCKKCGGCEIKDSFRRGVNNNPENWIKKPIRKIGR